LTLTNGLIGYGTDVAERSETAMIPGDSTRTLLLLLRRRGDRWEQQYIAHIALKALRTLSATRSDENFPSLRTRLIELGYDRAADLTPYEDRGQTP
jgi:hypothetical protein